MFRQQQKWNHEQCSYCGNANVQFICWECIESTLQDMQAEIDKNKVEIDRLKAVVKVLMAKNGIIMKEVSP